MEWYGYVLIGAAVLLIGVLKLVFFRRRQQKKRPANKPDED